MKLNELYNKPIKEVIEELEFTDMKVHTDDNGNVRSVELKYENSTEKREKEENGYGGSSKVFGK